MISAYQGVNVLSLRPTCRLALLQAKKHLLTATTKHVKETERGEVRKDLFIIILLSHIGRCSFSKEIT